MDKAAALEIDRVRGVRAVENDNITLETRAEFLAKQAVDYAMNAKESWYPDGHLDYDIFSGLLADAIEETILRPLLGI